LRILVAEDSGVNQKVMDALLRKLGYVADFVSDGAEAVDAVARQPYDVVFMDVQMPQMDGLEATKAICRRWKEGARPRIIALTAHATREDRDGCLRAGMSDYVSKPIAPAMLVEVLGRCAAIDRGIGNGSTPRGGRGARNSRVGS
jgi:CheY-like chemotaxis protein